MTVFVYNPYSERIERFEKSLSDAMPYVIGRTLTVDEFRGSSNASLIWTDRRVMETWNEFREFYGSPIPVRYAFKRIWEGGHSAQSQHYAGTSFDAGQSLTSAQRRRLYDSALQFGGFSYVEPINLTPTWVHFDRRLLPAACATGGYILTENGSRGVYVLVLQDALNALGFTGGGLDGIFGQRTKDALIRFQRSRNLSPDGVAGCATWRALTSAAVGIGRTPTVVFP